MKILYIISYVIILLALSSFASAYIYASPNNFTKQFYNHTPNYLRNNLEINFVSQINYYWRGYTWCYNKPYGKIRIIIYRNNWIKEDYNQTLRVLNHELTHAYQCRILNEYPSHSESFDRLNWGGSGLSPFPPFILK